MKYTLYIGNKNYSSWSMRAWIVMKHFDIEFNERLVRFDSFDDNSIFKKTILPLNPLGTVPILVDDDLVITDSLAICEYLADKHPTLSLWPNQTRLKAKARCVTAQMHSGYPQIRRYLPMNIEAKFAELGQIILRDHRQVKQEVAFFDRYISSMLDKSVGAYLFGDFTIADAFYAPMCIRLKNFDITMSPQVADYIDVIWQTKGIKEWVDDALNENDFIAMDEPYRLNNKKRQ